MNWKPDTILKIREFVRVKLKKLTANRVFLNEASMSIEQLLSEAIKRVAERKSAFTNSPHTVLDKQPILINHATCSQAKRCSQLLFDVAIKVKSAEIFLVHRTSHAGIFQALLMNIYGTIKKTAEAMFIDGAAGDLILNDITNYPKTIDSNLHYDEVTPTPLIGRREDRPKAGAATTTGRFRFSTFEDISIYNKDRVTSFLFIELSEIYALYQQQPSMRLINYIINYFVWIFIQPEILTINDDYFQRKEADPSTLPQNVRTNNPTTP